MRRLVVDSQFPDAAAIATAADVLRQGGVVAYPTDTLYGLAADPASDDAVRKLIELKGRGADSAIALIAADAVQARQAGQFGGIEDRLAARFWPGPLTIVVPAAAHLSALLSAHKHTLGVRVPRHAVARALAETFGGCITATSANLSGERPAMTADEVAATLGDRVDLLLDGGPSPGGPPSTVLEVVAGTLTLHRTGAVSWDRVLESVE
jgi:L-threonylcarbamoyladenylate synthase